MRSFIIIIFIFFCFFLIISLFILDPLPLFLVLFLAFLISFICLAYYFGPVRGILTGLIFLVLPFILEYYLYIFKLPLFGVPLIEYLTLRNINIQITLNNLFIIITVPLLFISALFFTQKIKILANIKNYHKTFLVIVSSLLVSLGFLTYRNNQINYQYYLKWLIIAFIINLLLVKLYKFKPKIDEIYKELPIIVYLAVFGSNALKRVDSLQLLIAGFLTIVYLILLYNEYRIQRIKLPF